MQIKKIAIFLILIFCIMGAASAAEDLSADGVDTTADAVGVDAVSDDVSDSIESVDVEQESVVDDSAVDSIDEEPLLFSSDSKLNSKLEASNSEILSNDEIIYYVNGSASGGDGSSWDEAFSGEWAIDDALCEIADSADGNAIIYIANGQYTGIAAVVEHALKYNVTFIGQGADTILEDISSTIYGMGANVNAYLTYFNFTINGGDLGRNSNFNNCIFNGQLSISQDLLNYEPRHIEESGCAQTYFMNFDNCVFKDVATADALVTLYKYGAVNFNNCTFENINANSLVYRNDNSYFDDDSITFKDCTFTNSKFNGVVDSAANFDDAIIIEDCIYDDEVAVGTTEVDGHFYVNATKLMVVAVDSAVDISSSEKGVVVIALTDNSSAPIAGATVKYTVNGGEEQTGATGEDGKFAVTGLTGEVTIAVSYEGNESFNPISDSQFFNFTEEPATNSTTPGGSTTPSTPSVSPAKKVTKTATKIVAAKKTFKVKTKVKKYTITLKTKAGKAIKKVKVTLKVKGKTIKATTNSKGKAVFKIKNLKKKGKYTATLKFAGNKNYKASTKKVRITVKK